MGESKRRHASRTIKKAPSIAAGWISYQEMVMRPQTSDVQRAECGLAFWAGATILFYSILDCLDPGEEATDADLAKLDAIHKEIDAFASTFDAEVLKRHGNLQ